MPKKFEDKPKFKIRRALRNTYKTVKRAYHNADRMRVNFKRKHPRVYRAIGRAADYALDEVPEYQLAKGAYNAYQGRNKGFRYQVKNAYRTAVKYQAARMLS
jgi:hypothetical protein